MAKSDHIDLDEELRPKRSGGTVKIPNRSVHPDEANLMDNWLQSAQIFERQWKARAREWRARRDLDFNSRRKSDEGSWSYNENETSKIWKPKKRKKDHQCRGSTCSEIKLEAHRGERGISRTYAMWLEGREMLFLYQLYAQYCTPCGNSEQDTLEDKFIPEQTMWRIFHCLISELIPSSCSTFKCAQARERRSTIVCKDSHPRICDCIPRYIIESPDTIWQAGKCMFHILTKGRFWNPEYYGIQPVDGGKFGEYKQNVLQKQYSKNLIKYVLACISADPKRRPSRHELLEHFKIVFSVYDHTYKPVIIHDSLALPYEPKDALIPTGLTNEEGAVYEKYLRVVDRRTTVHNSVKSTPHIAVITDIAKDYDDLLAMMCLKELHRLGVVVVKGFVANLNPAEHRALISRGALDSLNYSQEQIPVAVGTAGTYDPKKLERDRYEFDHTEEFIASPETELPDGQKLLQDIFTEAANDGHKITLVTLSSLMDASQFTLDHSSLFKNGISNVVLQGGYRLIDNKLIPDLAAQNNSWDAPSAQQFHTFMQDNHIPSTAWTKVAANAMPLYNSLFEFLEDTGHPLGPYLRAIQVKQDSDFYKRACSEQPFAKHMDQEWYITNRSTWFLCGHEPDEPYPDEDGIAPYFTKVIAYDALPAVAAAGNDCLEEFGIMKEIKVRKDMESDIHSVVGIPEVVDGETRLSQEVNFDAGVMGLIVTTLLKGSILAAQQGLGGR